MLLEAERNQRALMRLESLVKNEVHLREEAMTREACCRDEVQRRLEQYWHSETAQRRAVESHLEAKLSVMQREFKAEASRAVARDKEFSNALAQVHDAFRKEMRSHRMEINEVHEELAKTCEKLVQEAWLAKATEGKPSLNIMGPVLAVQGHFADNPGERVGTVGDTIVERSSQSLLSARQDVLDLRREFNSRLSAETHEREKIRFELKALQEERLVGSREHQHAPDWLAIVDEQGRLRRAVEGQAERMGNIHKEIQMELACLAAKGQSEGAACREEVSIVRQELERLREQISISTNGSGSREPEPAVESVVREEVRRQLIIERATLLVPRPDSSTRQEVVALLDSELRLRKASEEKLVSDVQSMLQHERQSRERDTYAMKARVDMAEQSIFIDSGKREERDRDMNNLIGQLREELNAFKQQFSMRQGIAGSVSRPASMPGSAARLAYVVSP